MQRQGKRANPFYQAQAILSQRDHSIAELAAKLRRRGFAVEHVSDAITRLQKGGLLNDERFAGAFIDSTMRRTFVGPRWLRHKLRQKGIENNCIAAALQSAFPPGREQKIAYQAAAAWRRMHPSRRQDTDRLARFLTSRGFSTSVISTLLAAELN